MKQGYTSQIWSFFRHQIRINLRPHPLIETAAGHTLRKDDLPNAGEEEGEPGAPGLALRVDHDAAQAPLPEDLITKTVNSSPHGLVHKRL